MSIEKRPVRVATAAGFSVHLFTASGGAVAVLALYAAIERHFAICFAWLGLALFIDGIDGTLARAAKVQETAAAIDGVVLDLVIDFLTYVLVPVIALWRSDLMPTEASFWIGLVVVIASALYFADTRMKTDDLWFRGFPATWNILVLYLFVLRPPWGVSAALLLGATALMFAPVVFVHPLRVVRLRVPTIVMTARLVRLRRAGDPGQPHTAPLGRRRPRRDRPLLPRAAPPQTFALGVSAVEIGPRESPCSGARILAIASASRPNRWVRRWPRGGVATQRTANPCTPVRFRARPPKNSAKSTKVPQGQPG